MTESVPHRAMVIMAHPDDIEYFVGGTVARWNAAGCDVTFVLATSGESGCDDLTLSRQQLAALRQAEQRAAARVLGVEQVLFLDAPDGEVTPTLELRRQLVAKIRRYRPATVIIPDPTRYYFFEQGYVNHPDHRATGEAALAAISPAATNPRYHPELLAEGLKPHQVTQIWLAMPPEPDHWVDITDVFETKLAAMDCHASQISDPTSWEQSLRRSSAFAGMDGLVGYREGFRRLMIA